MQTFCAPRHNLFFESFLRAPLHCVPASQNRAYWEQLRASLRRKERFWRQPVRHDFAAAAYSFKLSKTFFFRMISAGTSNLENV